MEANPKGFLKKLEKEYEEETSSPSGKRSQPSSTSSENLKPNYKKPPKKSKQKMDISELQASTSNNKSQVSWSTMQNSGFSPNPTLSGAKISSTGHQPIQKWTKYEANLYVKGNVGLF